MHRLKASNLWRMTFADLGNWMWGRGLNWYVLGLSGKVKKKLYQEFTGLETQHIRDIAFDEIGINVDISLQTGDKKYLARLIYFRSDNSGYELRKVKLYQPVAFGQKGIIDFSIDSPDKTVIGKCLRSIIK